MNEELIYRLQQGIPLVRRPFHAMARRLNLTEEEVLNTIQQLLHEGKARRLGAVFDARRLGYRSALCAMTLNHSDVAPIARIVSEHTGVTHCYERGWPPELAPNLPGGPHGEPLPNLWFTLAVLADQFDGQIQQLQKRVAPHSMLLLPAVRRFKIDVVFDLRTRDREEIFPGAPASETPYPEATPVLGDEERRIVRALQDHLPVEPDPYETIATNLNISEDDFLSRLNEWRERGVLRRVALVMRHERIGFKANGMCVWDVTEENALLIGRKVAAYPSVTHCYQRLRKPEFPYNLYAMIHTGEWPSTQTLFHQISMETGLREGRLLCSLQEFKKTSMRYFE
jgi:siroheme decarboxylase